MNISLVWYFDKANWVFPLYRDGVKAAMEELEKRGHKITWHLGLDPKIPEDCDFLLLWDSSNSEFIPKLKNYTCRKGLILTTDLGLNLDNLRNFDVIFPEVQYIADNLKAQGLRAIKAFGTDTDFFKPNQTKKIYEALYPATFSPWKRQNLFADEYKDRGLCIGTVQPDGWDILRYTIEKKTNVFIGYMPVEQLREYYDKSESVCITGWEGSGRTVIEGLSMGLPVESALDNVKCQSYLKEFHASKLSPRDFAVKYYSASIYADQLLKGIINV